LNADSIRPFFLDGPAGPLFAVYYSPKPGRGDAGDLVYVPPFAEEMNRSRRMVAVQARALAEAGTGVLVLDLYGTGDSGGEFRDGRWAVWLGDVAAAVEWLGRQGRQRIGLWGLRLGAILAMQAATRVSGIDRAVLWQPVTNGETMLTQFLRIRVAAGMGGGRGAETTQDLRARLASGDSIEVAGYELAPELAAAIDAARLERWAPANAMPVHWLELVPETGRPISPAGARVVESWQEKGVPVTAAVAVGDPFWTLQETTLAPDLITVTGQLLEESVP